MKVLTTILVIVLVLAGGYWFYMRSSSNNYATQTASNARYTTPNPSTYSQYPNQGAPANSTPSGSGSSATQANLKVLNVSDTPKLGSFLTAISNAMTLYVFSKDTPGVSNCTGGCASAWPPYTVSQSDNLTAEKGIMGKISTIKRADGTMQVTYNGMPLYFFASDSKPGDTNGQGVAGMWMVVKP